MNYSYEMKIKVPYPECDIANRLRLSNIMRYVQQIGGVHLDSVGYTYQKMAEDGFVLLLAKEGLSVKRVPVAGEEIIIRSTPRMPKGATLLRDCSFIDKQGEEIIFAETTWVAAHTDTHRIIRPSDLPYNFFESPEQRDYTVTGMRVKEPDSIAEIGKRRIAFSDIDCNRHLNNAVYADIVYDFLPLETAINRDVTQFYVNFQSEAEIGEEIAIKRAELPDGSYYLSGTKEDGKTCFIAIIVLR